MVKLTPNQIRAARVGNTSERFDVTACRLRVHPFDVQRAMAFESLTAEERDTILDRYIAGDRFADIVSDIGTTATAVHKTIRGALIWRRVEDALA
ncbi:hypothetical protein QCE63_06905 [Caballeronia sp. LZ065]|uniref:hypothetical protein n=1 Tax=Caballeronia sp. LZ065 TaxID=3038571 RepID=UPI0028581000|nr:hypothetical protein [Caballeronia sp. LZ065]MDR5779157.1 hypothetical protein [Caballeronia sp. LZ065]